MPTVLGPVAAVFSILLILTGAAKLRRPEFTARALASLGFPHRKLFGLALGFLEIGLGSLALGTGEPFAMILQGAMYGLFTAWMGTALYSGVPIESCGCLGTPDTPPYWGHLVLDVIAAGVSLGAAAMVTNFLPGTPVEAVATGLAVAAAIFLAWLIIGDGARLHGAATT